MIGRLDKDGALSIFRWRDHQEHLVEQCCCKAIHSEPCGDWCPMFTRQGVTEASVVCLKCGGEPVFIEITTKDKL